MACVWEETTLEAVCDLITDGAHLSPPSVPIGKPMASVKDLTSFGIRIDSCRRISEEDFTKLVRQGCQPRKGDVLIAKDGATALDTVCEVKKNEDVVLLSSVAILRPNSTLIDSAYLRYYLDASTTRSYLKGSFISGAAIPRVVLKDLKRAMVRVPPLLVQRRIAGILSAYDDLIENNLRRIRILEEMARALYREWFVHFRFPGHESAPRVASALGPIPQGWKAKRLDEIAENFDRLRRPLSKMERAGMQGEYPYYGAAKVFDYVNNYIFDGEYLLMAEDGSVITTERAPVLQLVNEKFWPNNHTHVLRGKAPVSTHFLFLGLSLVDISPYITGAAQPKITQENMNRIPFFCGPEDLHRDFDRLAAPMIRQSQVLQRQTANLRRTRDLLLPQLLSGKALINKQQGYENAKNH